MRYPSLLEASRYYHRLPPRMYDIYSEGSSNYSNFKTLVFHKEFAIPSADYTISGIIPELGLVWYFIDHFLFFFNYESNTVERVATSISPVLFVKFFTPLPDIFSSKVRGCILIVTVAFAKIYAYDGQEVIKTEFSTSFKSTPTSVTVDSGRIFIGFEDGNVYQAIYHNLKLFGYRFLKLYSPNGLFHGIFRIFRKAKKPIIDLSASQTRLVSLSDILTVYSIETGICKLFELIPDRKYINVQIAEESPLMIACAMDNGDRDFYTEKGRFLSKDLPFHERISYSSNIPNNQANSNISGRESQSSVVSNHHQFVIHSKSATPRINYISFNVSHLRNFSRANPVENHEILPFFKPIRAVSLTATQLGILTDSSISIYTILDSKSFFLSCKSLELQQMCKWYGDLEFMVRYFDLISIGEDVGRMSTVCSGAMIKNFALFVSIYSLIKPVYTIELQASNDEPAAHYDSASPGDILISASNISIPASDPSFELDNIVARLKILKNALPLSFKEAHCLIDEIIQARYYVALLNSYGVKFKATLEQILSEDLNSEQSFRKDSLTSLLETASFSKSVEPLVKSMNNRCPLFLPYEEINMQQGLELLRNGEVSALKQSLKYFLNAKFDKVIVQRYNELGYYVGSTILVRDKFHSFFKYETTLSLLQDSVKCKSALEAGLKDNREEFLYPLFEAIIGIERFSPCCCCSNPETTVDLMKIDKFGFEAFLKDASARNVSNKRVYNMYWRYLLARGKKVKAAEAMLALCERPEIDFNSKMELLEQTLTIATSAGQEGNEIRMEIKNKIKLGEIQAELMERDPSTATPLLMSADQLFNDFCYKYPDLGIRLLDVIGYSDAHTSSKPVDLRASGDTRLIRGLFAKYLEHGVLSDALSLIGSLRHKNLWLIIDLLAGMPDASEKLLFTLEEHGFGRAEIIRSVKGALDGHCDPRCKEVLTKGLERYVAFSDINESAKNIRAF